MRSLTFLLTLVILFTSFSSSISTNFDRHNSRRQASSQPNLHVNRQITRRDLTLGESKLTNGLFTNSERLKRGLGIKPPAHFEKVIVNGRIRFIPSTTRTKRISPSQGPSISGTIKVIKLNKDGSEGGTLGYIAAALTPYKEFTVTPDKGAALIGKIPSSGSGPFAIASTNGDARYPYLGGILNEYKRPDFAAEDWSWAYLGATGLSTPLSPPSAVGNSRGNARIESSIWYIKSYTKQITAKWVNMDGSAWSATTIAYQPRQNYLFITGDLVEFNHVSVADYGESVPVKFVFEASN